MADEDACEHEMFVAIRWGHRASDSLAVPLAQLDVVHAEDETTAEAVADWHYWDERYSSELFGDASASRAGGVGDGLA